MDDQPVVWIPVAGEGDPVNGRVGKYGYVQLYFGRCPNGCTQQFVDTVVKATLQNDAILGTVNGNFTQSPMDITNVNGRVIAAGTADYAPRQLLGGDGLGEDAGAKKE